MVEDIMYYTEMSASLITFSGIVHVDRKLTSPVRPTLTRKFFRDWQVMNDVLQES